MIGMNNRIIENKNCIINLLILNEKIYEKYPIGYEL